MEETIKGDDDEGVYSPAASSIKKAPVKYERTMQNTKPPLPIRHIMFSRVRILTNNRNKICQLKR